MAVHTPPGSPDWKISTNTGGRIWVVPEDFRGVDDLRGTWCGMSGELVKVDRVRSAAEAAALEAAGAGLIGIELDPDPRFADARTSTVAQAAAVRGALRRATLVAALDVAGDPARVVRTIAAVGAGLVQPIRGAIPAPAVRAALDDVGIGIVHAGIEIAHDDDPSWVFSRYGEGAALFQADVLPEYRDAWAFLRDRAPEYDEEFQIADLDELGRQRPLVVGLDFTPDNVTEVVAALPAVRGIALTLADGVRRDDVHVHSHAEAMRIVQSAAGR